MKSLFRPVPGDLSSFGMKFRVVFFQDGAERTGRKDMGNWCTLAVQFSDSMKEETTGKR
jgi:hypothetical protein